MDEPRLVQQAKPVEELLGKDPDESRAQASELVLLDQLIEIDRQQLKDQAQMLSVDECIFQS